MKYSDLPESEKIPLRITMATRLYLDMILRDGWPVESIERSQHNLAADEQYSGAEGAKRAIAISRLPVRKAWREYMKIVDATYWHDYEPTPFPAFA